MERAYSELLVKSVGEDSRTITGVATTPSPDRVGDVIDPAGVEFDNPLPLLLHHNHTQPVGQVTLEQPTRAGIRFTAVLPRISEQGSVKELIDSTWIRLKSGLLRHVSVGFRTLGRDAVESIAGGGLRFLHTEILELSLVAIPANADARIETVKALDAQLLAKLATHTEGSSDVIARRIGFGTTRREGTSSMPRRVVYIDSTKKAARPQSTHFADYDGEARKRIDELANFVFEVTEREGAARGALERRVRALERALAAKGL